MNATQVQKYSKLSVSKLKAKAQTVFNKWIRNRDSGQPCISCGGFKELQAGHFYSAGHHNGLRFDEDNCHGQCLKCNYFLSGNLLQYRARLEKKIGLERLAVLDLKAGMKKASKDDKFTLIKIIEKYGGKEK